MVSRIADPPHKKCPHPDPENCGHDASCSEGILQMEFSQGPWNEDDPGFPGGPSVIPGSSKEEGRGVRVRDGRGCS